ncbi:MULTISPECIES: sporulation protein YunB [unclassified Ruminococcus]|uniref:sporulation protein YunB n=1 Tax=unclassified Ruminococcus TaxID=2608920 RepID=UPI002109CDB4
MRIRRMWRRKKSRGRKIFVTSVMLVIVFLSYIEFQIQPSVMDLTEIKAQTLATEAINTAVNKTVDSMKLTYDELADIKYTSDNKVSSISTNTVNVNKLKAAVSLEIQNQLQELQHREFNYYLGDLTGFELLNGLGPSLNVRLNFSSSVETDVKNKLESAGINQTQSIIEIHVLAEIFLTSDEEYPNAVVETTLPVAQTLIVGEMPNYLPIARYY